MDLDPLLRSQHNLDNLVIVPDNLENRLLIFLRERVNERVHLILVLF